MKLILSFIVIVAFALMPISAKGNEGKVGEKDAAVKNKNSVWTDIKKAPGPKVSEIPKKYDDLVKTFSVYYDALKTRDYKKAYNLESDGYRKATSFDLYNERLKKSVEIMAVRALEVKPINEKEVMVSASVGFKAVTIDTVRFIQDRWVKEDQGWRHLPKGRE